MSFYVMEQVDQRTNLHTSWRFPSSALPLFCLEASSSNSTSKKASAPGSPVLNNTHMHTQSMKQRRQIGYEINNGEVATSNGGSKESMGGRGGGVGVGVLSFSLHQ